MAPNHGVSSMLLTNITNALFINKWMKYSLINNWSPVSLFHQVQWKKISGKPLQSRFWHQAIYVYKCINLYKIAEKMFHWLQNRKMSLWHVLSPAVWPAVVWELDDVVVVGGDLGGHDLGEEIFVLFWPLNLHTTFEEPMATVLAKTLPFTRSVNSWQGLFYINIWVMLSNHL